MYLVFKYKKVFSDQLWGQVGIAARYPRYKDEILSINRNITLKKGKNKISFLNKHIGNK